MSFSLLTKETENENTGPIHLHRQSLLIQMRTVQLQGNLNKFTLEPLLKLKEEGKDQESMQSSTTPDPGHHMEK